MKEEFKVYQKVFDNRTIMTLYQLSKKYFRTIGGPIKTGKESDVYLLYTKEGGKIVAKIYKIETSNFRNMWKYIKGDSRFPYIGKEKKKLVYAWTEKEFRNLWTARRMGIPAPEPIAFKNNVLLMEFIGDDSPAPIAKYHPPKDPKRWYRLIMGYVDKMEKEGFVHGDLSEFNILNWNEKPILIDWSQSVFRDHPLFEELLERDRKNMERWFSSLGV